MKEKRKVSIYKGNGSPIVATKIRRNDKCSCNSGKKAKNCCGAYTSYFDSKPDEELKLKGDKK